MAETKEQKSPFEALTWDDLDSWAGSKIVGRGKSYQREGYAEELAVTASGALVAWVHGTRTCATRVEMQDGRLTSACSCPYGYTCKHAVAVVLEYLEKVKAKAAVPSVGEDDPRLAKLDQEDDDDWDDDDRDDEERDGDEDDAPVSGRTAGKAPRKDEAETLTSFLNHQTKKELVELIEELASNFSAVGKALQGQQALASGAVGTIVKSIRDEILDLTSEPAWRDPRSGGGNVPDYSNVRERLTHLLENGHADEVEKKPEEVIRWYDLREEEGRGERWPRHYDDRNAIANAVMDRFPDRSIAIWKRLAESEIARTSPKAYEVAAGYLREVREVMAKNEKQKEWAAYLGSIRRDHKRKSRLMETLDRLERRPI